MSMTREQQHAIQRLGRLIGYIEEECDADSGESICHGHDRPDAGGCALASDLNEIHAALKETT